MRQILNETKYCSMIIRLIHHSSNVKRVFTKRKSLLATRKWSFFSVRLLYLILRQIKAWLIHILSPTKLKIKEENSTKYIETDITKNDELITV